MPDNPFRDNSHQEVTNGENILNLSTRRVVRIHRPDGSVEDVLISSRESVPDANGNYSDTEVIGLLFDHAGNQIPQDLHNFKLSHSGITIRPGDKTAFCNCWLHPRNQHRLIAVGQDGKETPDGAICSSCQFKQDTIGMVICVIAVVMIIGIFKGTGVF